MIDECSTLAPAPFSKLPLTLSKKPEKFISSITFNCIDIATIIRGLDTNKAHGNYMINIRMLET